MPNPQASSQRKQRKARFNATSHDRHKFLSAHLDEKLFAKYQRRSLPVRKGDTVKVVRGDVDFRKEARVAKVDTKHSKIIVEGVTIPKMDGKEKPYPVHPSNCIITKLDLSDRWRRRILGRKLKPEAAAEVEREAEEAKPKPETKTEQPKPETPGTMKEGSK